MPPRTLKNVLKDAVQDTVTAPGDQKDGLVLTRVLGVQLMQRLQKTVESGVPSEAETWLWGEKENAVSLWVKLSVSLLKVIEYETLLGAGLTPKTEIPLSAEDQSIIERFVALRRHEHSGTHAS